MKRVLIFSLSYYPHVGGAEVALKEITDRISDVEFHLIALNLHGGEREKKIGNVIVHRVGNGKSYLQKILFIPRAASYAARLNNGKSFDALWAMMSYMVFPIALLRIKRIRLPYLITLQEGDPWEHMFGRWFIVPFRPLLKYGFRHATSVQAISTFLAGWATRMGFRGTSVIISNGVDIAHFSNVGHRKSYMSGDTTILVTSSRLVHKNAIDDVIRALALLPESVRFHVYGIGPDESKLKQLAEELGVSDRVEWFGYVDHKDLPSALSECDIFVRPSRSEGMGNAFIEAMAAGLPFIATQEGGIADFLFDAKRDPNKETTGWAVDKDSPEQIAEAVKEILENPEQAARVTETAKKFVSINYDWHTVAVKMKALLENVMNTGIV